MFLGIGMLICLKFYHMYINLYICGLIMWPSVVLYVP